MSMRENIMRQFGNPKGFAGMLAGWIMATRSSNRKRNEWTISLLNLKRNSNVLEVGCGPGIALAAAAKQITSGKIIGVDHSELMLQKARKRNKGRAEFILASVESLPEFEHRFDAVYSVNSIMFWTNPVSQLAKLKTLLKENGTIALTMQPRQKNATQESTLKAGEQLESYLKQAGFKNIQKEFLTLKPVPAVCVLGTL